MTEVSTAQVATFCGGYRFPKGLCPGARCKSEGSSGEARAGFWAAMGLLR